MSAPLVSSARAIAECCSRFDQFGPLRVINEDSVLAGEGFGTHSHREFEIVSTATSKSAGWAWSADAAANSSRMSLAGNSSTRIV